jgi:uncharacterized damage-inducible protein DinB
VYNIKQSTIMETTNATATVITPEQILKHWQGHRGLTRRVIEAFPEKELFTFSVGGMRPFAQLAMEIIDLTGPGVEGIITGEWPAMGALPHASGKGMPETKEALLAKWDETTQTLNHYFSQIMAEQFSQPLKAFGAYDGTVLSSIQYYVDNEIHHRAQGYVYLRALGIEPPAFWDRP